MGQKQHHFLYKKPMKRRLSSCCSNLIGALVVLVLVWIGSVRREAGDSIVMSNSKKFHRDEISNCHVSSGMDIKNALHEKNTNLLDVTKLLIQCNVCSCLIMKIDKLSITYKTGT